MATRGRTDATRHGRADCRPRPATCPPNPPLAPARLARDPHAPRVATLHHPSAALRFLCRTEPTHPTPAVRKPVAARPTGDPPDPPIPRLPWGAPPDRTPPASRLSPAPRRTGTPHRLRRARPARRNDRRRCDTTPSAPARQHPREVHFRNVFMVGSGARRDDGEIPRIPPRHAPADPRNLLMHARPRCAAECGCPHPQVKPEWSNGRPGHAAARPVRDRGGSGWGGTATWRRGGWPGGKHGGPDRSISAVRWGPPAAALPRDGVASGRRAWRRPGPGGARRLCGSDIPAHRSLGWSAPGRPGVPPPSRAG